ncbi:MAG: hypothetical protein ACI3ZF_07145 [Candidatus Cryptobacteroides sp.]
MKEPSAISSSLFNTSTVMNNMNIGLWSMEIIEGQKIKMYVDPTAAALMGIPENLDPYEVCERWRAGVDEKANILITDALNKIAEGKTSEAQYTWSHPDGSKRLIRCGGQRDWSFKEGIRITGTHQDITGMRHVDNEWNLRRIMLKSYFNYYNSRDALAILLVNMQNDHYATVKSSPEIENRLPLNDEGVFSEYIKQFAELIPHSSHKDKILHFQDYEYLDEYFKTAPIYGEPFSGDNEKGGLKWYKIIANRLNDNDIVVSIEDRTHRVSENIILKTLSNRQIGGFIFNLKRNVISVVKLTPFFDYLDGYTDNLSIDQGVEMLCPHIDKEFRRGWRQFASLENLQSVYNTQRRADYPFKAKFAGNHTWLRASLHAVDVSMSEEPSVVLVFRRYSKEELEETVNPHCS